VGTSDRGCPISAIEGGGGEIRLLVRGDLSQEAWLVQVMRELVDRLDDPRAINVIVDMSGVTGLDKQSMAAWVWLNRFVQERHRCLRIVNPSAVVLAAAERDP
jgi:ABC-type transporter Mla MlaB component